MAERGCVEEDGALLTARQSANDSRLGPIARCAFVAHAAFLVSSRIGGANVATVLALALWLVALACILKNPHLRGEGELFRSRTERIRLALSRAHPRHTWREWRAGSAPPFSA